MAVLRGIGYWIETGAGVGWRDADEGARLPDPRELASVAGQGKPDPRILDYLRSGKELYAELGFSYCRFQCGIPDEHMGCRDLTDGVWAWPEGLAHYVEFHKVPLPMEFLDTAARNGWRVPSVEPLEDGGYTLDYWIDWCRRMTVRPTQFE